jgi:hypothetical protein
MLYTLLNAAPRVFSMRAEGRFIWWMTPELRHLHLDRRGWESGVLTAEDANPAMAPLIAQAYYRCAVPNRSVVLRYPTPDTEPDQETFVERFMEYLKERNKPLRWSRPFNPDPHHPMEQVLMAIKQMHQPLRFVEKTPANCLRVSFLNALFPDALFIYLKRDGRGNINSLMEGWKADVTQAANMETFGYNVPVELGIPEISHKQWRYTLPRDWRDYMGRPLEEVATFQWIESNRSAMDDLAAIASERVRSLSYEDLVEDTPGQVRAMCEFIGVPFEGSIKKRCADPPVRNALTPPDKEKWRRQNGPAIERMLPVMEPMMRRMGYGGAGVAGQGQPSAIMAQPAER